MDALRQVLASEDATTGLDRAALDLARVQFPELEPEPFLARLNELASALGDRLRNFNDGRDFVEKAQSYLFGELGFRGNEADFFDPLNSCLNQVIERRTGIPITLSVLYMEVARRLQMPVYGVSLPRRFVIQFDDGNYATFIDPFGGGRTISPRQCFALAGAEIPDPAMLGRASKKQIVMRMLQNLLEAYRRRGDREHAVATLDLLLEGAPETALWYRERGLLAGEMQRFSAARRDLERYLALEPGAADRPAVAGQIEAIHRRLAQMN